MKQENKESLFYFIIGVIFLICFGFIASSARAEVIPAGCYVADYYRTDECWGEGYTGYFTWYDNLDYPIDYYGNVMATMVYQEKFYRTQYADVAKKLSKEKSLSKKLRKACGSKCKRIK